MPIVCNLRTLTTQALCYGDRGCQPARLLTFRQFLLPLLAAMLAGPSGAFGRSVAIRGGGIAVEVSEGGEITAGRIGTAAQRMRGSTSLPGCSVCAVRSGRRAGLSGVEFEKTLECGQFRHSVKLIERFTPTPTSVRWDLELTSSDTRWSTPVDTWFQYANASAFWTSWAHPQFACPAGKTGTGSECQKEPWADPLVAVPLRNAVLFYGAPAFSSEGPRIPFGPFNGNLFSIPIATLLDASHDRGISLVLSPDDKLLDLTLTTTAQGEATFSRLFHRFGPAPLRFHMDLVAHEGDWRGGLRWMTGRYPEYFDPPIKGSEELAGTCAYSNYEGELDFAALKAMAFRTNWKASFDFPYMGMFLPPVENETWRRFGTGTTSIAQMRNYAVRMRKLGFYVLDYFNVTEFGTRIVYPPPLRKAASDADLWRDPNDFLYARFPSAILFVPERMKLSGKSVSRPGQPYYTWEDAVVLDPGDPEYRRFLLEQAQRHISEIPESSGIAIDRMDWLRVYNDRADDGVSWFEGQPARSLLNSWRGLMEQLGPLMHRAGKFIFVNNHIKRIDLVQHADGFFDECAYGGAPLNLTAFLGIHKTTLGWTAGEAGLRPDPDAFFQRHLYLGIYPMAPFPGNDHSLRPSEWVNEQFLAYGPLLDAIRGRKWVLAPHAVRVESGGGVKANLFEVPEGYLVPVVFGGNSVEASVLVSGVNVQGYTAEVLHPGEMVWDDLALKRAANNLRFVAPLKNGCAMVRLRRLRR